MSKRYGSVADRFWKDVWPEPMSGCWLWTGPIDDNGYGRFRVGKRKKRLHQVSYEMHNDVIPSGLVVRHTCDNRLCVNPDHLIVGTPADNVADMDARNRRSIGERHHSKLTGNDVIAIRADDRTLRAIGADYGVAHSIILRIKRREDWRHVP